MLDGCQGPSDRFLICVLDGCQVADSCDSVGWLPSDGFADSLHN